MFSFATASAACPSGTSAGRGTTMGITSAAMSKGAGSTGGGGNAGAATLVMVLVILLIGL